MKTATAMCFQGDVCFRVVDMPADVVEVPVKGPVIVAHSETGHHHAIEEGAAKLFEKLERDPMICFLQVSGEYADVVHHRTFDTHETARLLNPGPGKCWAALRQEEWTPEGMRRVED